jgi:cytochrome d ubiquinol oxidase subunit I
MRFDAAVVVAAAHVSGQVVRLVRRWRPLSGSTSSRRGAVLGFPFGVEGLFFFLEAIFTAIYLYGWRRLPGWAHFWSGMPIALSGILGAMSVIAVNSGRTCNAAGRPSGLTDDRVMESAGG